MTTEKEKVEAHLKGLKVLSICLSSLISEILKILVVFDNYSELKPIIDIAYYENFRTRKKWGKN